MCLHKPHCLFTDDLFSGKLAECGSAYLKWQLVGGNYKCSNGWLFFNNH